MIPIGVGIGAVAATLAGGVLLTAVLIAPQPAPAQTIWFDQPDDYSTVAAGGAVIAMHASSPQKITQFRLIVTRDHEVVTVLNDTTPDSVFFGDQASPLVSGATQWTADPGSYRLTPSYLTAAGWVSGLPVRVTVPDGELVVPTGPDLVAPPTSSPEPAETPPPDEPAEEQPADDAPTQGPAAPTPTPTPSSSTPATPPPAPTGTARRQLSGATTTFVAEGISPQNAVVDVQVQVTADYNGPAKPTGTWKSVGCGNLSAQSGTSPTKYTCTTAAWTAPRSSGYQTGHVRVVVTSAGGTVTTYGSNWLIEPSVN